MRWESHRHGVTVTGSHPSLDSYKPSGLGQVSHSSELTLVAVEKQSPAPSQESGCLHHRRQKACEEKSHSVPFCRVGSGARELTGST